MYVSTRKIIKLCNISRYYREKPDNQTFVAQGARGKEGKVGMKNRSIVILMINVDREREKMIAPSTSSTRRSGTINGRAAC